MEKYLIIIGILIGLYFIYKYNESITENFEATAQSLGGVDDANSINTLAQIARNLMAGTLTVPGGMTLKGDLTFPDANTIKGAGRLHISSGETLYLLPKTNTIIGKEWGGTGDLVVQGNQAVGGNLGVGAALNVGGALTAGGALTVNGVTNINNDVTMIGGKTINAKGRLHITADENIYLLQKGPTLMSKAWGGSGDLIVEGNESVNGRLTVGGRLFIPKPNLQATDGYDGPGDYGNQGDIMACANFCVNRNASTMVAMRRKSDGHCWCKDGFTWFHNNGEFDSMITL